MSPTASTISFAASISLLGVLQAALVALPRSRRLAWLDALRSPWWGLLPALSIVVVVGVVAWEGGSATALAWLALVAVPPSAALALGWILRGARPEWAVAVIPLLALSWAAPGSLVGEACATALTALGCVGLGWLLVSVAPARWLVRGIYAMAVVDAFLVAADLLQGPSAVLSTAAPADLPRLQAIHFGSARMGFGDLFVAGTVGCLLAAVPSRQLRAAVLAGGLVLAFDLLFFAVDTLPATVPVALALALAGGASAGVPDERDRIDREKPGDRESDTEP